MAIDAAPCMRQPAKSLYRDRALATLAKPEHSLSHPLEGIVDFDELPTVIVGKGEKIIHARIDDGGVADIAGACHDLFAKPHALSFGLLEHGGFAVKKQLPEFAVPFSEVAW